MKAKRPTVKIEDRHYGHLQRLKLKTGMSLRTLLVMVMERGLPLVESALGKLNSSHE